MNNVSARGLIIPNGCCMCMVDGEFACHLFLYCPTIVGQWNFFLADGAPWVQPVSIRELFCC